MSPLDRDSLRCEPNSSPNLRHPQYNPIRCLCFPALTRAIIKLGFPLHRSLQPPHREPGTPSESNSPPPDNLSAIQPVMTALGRYSSTSEIATAIYASPTKSPTIRKLTSGTSTNAFCSAVTRIGSTMLPETCSMGAINRQLSPPMTSSVPSFTMAAPCCNSGWLQEPRLWIKYWRITILVCASA